MTNPTQPASPKSDILALAQKVGFESVRITSPEGIEKNADYFSEFLDKSRHGEMKWMEEKVERRKSPLNLWPEVKSIIMLGMNYGPAHDPLETLKRKSDGIYPKIR